VRLSDGTTGCGGLSHEAVLAVLANKGRPPMSDSLRCKVRFFRDGAVFRGRGFVEGIFTAHRGQFGPRRKRDARRSRGVQEDLFALRDPYPSSGRTS